MHVASCGLTDVGCKRRRNEDRFCISDRMPLLAVADGMGGRAGGDYAASLAVHVLEDVLWATELASETPVVLPLERPALRLRMAIETANRSIFDYAREDASVRGMGTTLVAAWMAAGRAWIGHVGDSRAYLWRDGRLRCLTRDHTWVAERVQAGELSAEQARNHSERHVLSRALGQARSVQVEMMQCDIVAGDRLLLCSDGLYSGVSFEDMEAMVGAGTTRTATHALVMAARRSGGEDNITAVVARVDACDDT